MDNVLSENDIKLGEKLRKEYKEQFSQKMNNLTYYRRSAHSTEGIILYGIFDGISSWDKLDIEIYNSNIIFTYEEWEQVKLDIIKKEPMFLVIKNTKEKGLSLSTLSLTGNDLKPDTIDTLVYLVENHYCGIDINVTTCNILCEKICSRFSIGVKHGS